MSTPGEEGWKARLLDLMAQSDDPDAAFQASPWASDPACAEWFAELRALEGRLSSAGKRVRSDLADAERESSAPGEDRLHALLLEARDREPKRGSPPGAPDRAPKRVLSAVTLLPWLAAAAALLVWFAWPRPAPREDPGPVLLGSKGELFPSGATNAYAFRWTFERPPAGYFVVRVLAEAVEPGGQRSPLFTSSPIREHEWRPDAATAASWPRRIHWELLVHDGSSPRPAAVHSATAWLE